VKGALTVGVALVALLGTVPSGSAVVVAQQARTSSERTPWGEPDLRGVWQGPALGARPGRDQLNLAKLEVLYRPDVRAKRDLAVKDDPTLNCGAPAFPRAAALGKRIQILQKPRSILVLTEAFHSFRNIPTDGRPHTSEEFRIPFTMGDSSGQWDGDALIVDVISFKGDSWLAGSQDRPTKSSTGVWPTSDAMHVTERWRRIDANTLAYQARVEDPGMLTGAWETPTISLKRLPVTRIQEVVCQVDDPAIPPASYLDRLGR